MINHPNRKRKTGTGTPAPKAKTRAKPAARHDPFHDYSPLLTGPRMAFAAALAPGLRLFQTGASGLYDAYLDTLPSQRQVHTCHCCRRFIETYGGLVTIDAGGKTLPVMWDESTVSDFYKGSFRVLRAIVAKAKVTSPFLTTAKMWGTPVTGEWSHISVEPPHSMIHRDRLLTPDQAMAAAKENFRVVASALADFKPAMLDQALRLLEADTLSRSDKFVGPVRWLRELQNRPSGRWGDNVLWRAIADAPEGYCHPRASVIGSLLEDISAGMSFETIKTRFNAKLAPLQYQRPQAAPAAGNIRTAEAIVAKLGIERSLERRYARLDDLRETIWEPHGRTRPPQATGTGVFWHLPPKAPSPFPSIALPAMTVTWEKFSRVVLPDAEKLRIMVPSRGRFIAITTAVHADAPPILKWDDEAERNPLAWYVYPGGSSASQWSLSSGWANVTAATLLPPMLGSHPKPHLGNGVVLVIEGARDTNLSCSNALFPECLKDDLYAVRSTIESYSRSASLSGRQEASVCGYDLRNSAADCILSAFVHGAWTGYKIDRWD